MTSYRLVYRYISVSEELAVSVHRFFIMDYAEDADSELLQNS
jgi:hypothetical protein